MKIFLAAFAAVITLAHFPAAADSLPRHGSLGAAIAEKNGAVVIRAVVPNSAADASGLMAGDVIATIDGTPVHTVRDFLSRLRRPANQPVALEITRNGASISKTIVLRAVPDENDPLVETSYGTITVDGSLRRILTSYPRKASGKHPGILFVGGIGCFSIDDANVPFDPYRSLAHDLGRHGFVTLRLEKSGIGDSQGPPCASVDFTRESASYDVALAALKSNPLVDARRVYVFGHSIGSVIAPRLAVEHSVAGLIVAEGVGINWIEYELANLRRQLLLTGENPNQIWQDMQTKEYCMHRLLIEKQSEQSLIHARPDCAQAIAYPVSPAYMQEVARVNTAYLWTRENAPVLAIYGTSDFITAQSDHEYIISIVDGKHPHHGQLKVIGGMDHYLATAASQADSFRLTGANAPRQYDPAFSQTILAWLCEREDCTKLSNSAAGHS